MVSKRGKSFRPSRRTYPDLEPLCAPRIVIVGCGGAGNNTISRLSCLGLIGAKTVAVNTDIQHLDCVNADQRVLIGKRLTGGLGAGGKPYLGRQAAEAGKKVLEEILDGADLVFITAGMGGGTGTGAAPVIARIAKEKGATVIGLVTTPSHLERARVLVAEEGISELRHQVDTLIVIDNNRLLACAPNLPLDRAFSIADRLIAEVIKGITETITEPSLINLDYADVRTVIRSGGPSYILVGDGSIRESAQKIVNSALRNPLLDVDCRGATACLLHITGGSDLTLKFAAEIASVLTHEVDKEANVIWGARVEDGLEGKVRLMAIITGVRSSHVLCPSELDSQGCERRGPWRDIKKETR